MLCKKTCQYRFDIFRVRKQCKVHRLPTARTNGRTRRGKTRRDLVCFAPQVQKSCFDLQSYFYFSIARLWGIRDPRIFCCDSDCCSNRPRCCTSRTQYDFVCSPLGPETCPLAGMFCKYLDLSHLGTFPEDTICTLVDSRDLLECRCRFLGGI